MKNVLNKSQIERFSRQLVLKKIGAKGQKKILSSKILVVGIGGLGCPAAENLVRAGIGTIGLVDNDFNVKSGNLFRLNLREILVLNDQDFSNFFHDIENVDYCVVCAINPKIPKAIQSFKSKNPQIQSLEILTFDSLNPACAA